MASTRVRAVLFLGLALVIVAAASNLFSAPSVTPPAIQPPATDSRYSSDRLGKNPGDQAAASFGSRAGTSNIRGQHAESSASMPAGRLGRAQAASESRTAAVVISSLNSGPGEPGGRLVSNGCVATGDARRSASDACELPSDVALPEALPVRRGVVILGMHRSGTSLITLLLEQMGGFLGSDPSNRLVPKRGNPLGFGELRSMVEANVFLLSKGVGECPGGSCAFAPLAGESVFEIDDVDDSVKAAFRQMISDDVDDLRQLDECRARFWVQKEPRMCLTLSAWLSMMGAAPDDVPPAAIMMFRHPLSVARSLNKRNQYMSIEFGVHAWEAYTVAGLRQARAGKVPLVPVNYDQLMSHPTERLLGVMDDLGSVGVVLPPREEWAALAAAAVDVLVRDDLRHTAVSEELDAELLERFPSAARLYTALVDGTLIRHAQCCGADCPAAPELSPQAAQFFRAVDCPREAKKGKKACGRPGF